MYSRLEARAACTSRQHRLRVVVAQVRSSWNRNFFGHFSQDQEPKGLGALCYVIFLGTFEPGPEPGPGAIGIRIVRSKVGMKP